MSWVVVQCTRLYCSQYMLTRGGAKRKKCPYCGRSFKVIENTIKGFPDQLVARKFVRICNQRI